MTLAEALQLGVQQHQAGNLQQAEQIYQAILQADPQQAEALHLLGLVAFQVGHPEMACTYLTQALRFRPDFAVAHNSLGVVLKSQGKLAEAEACYQQALRLNPDYAEAHYNLGNVWQGQGKPAEAVACYQQALRLRPDYAEAHNNLGNALKEQGQPAEAAACYQQALRLKPDYAEAHNNLGNALKEQGQPAEAVACYRQALRLKPDYAEAHNNLGNILKEQGRLAEAAACYQQALRLKPSYAAAHNNLGVVLMSQGRLEEAAACSQQALRLKPDYAEAHSNFLLTLHYRAGVTLQELARAHAEFDRRYAAPLCGAWRPHANDRDPDRRLLLGFLSPDFGRHPVGYFLIRALEHLDPRHCAVVCYSNRSSQDDLTGRFRAAASAWRDVAGWNDERLAEQVRTDRVDLLVDLAGHTAQNRLLVFARKPAPVQVTWLGYEGTTGLAAMDYLLADRHVVPPGAEAHYREDVLRLPDDYVCFEPPEFAPPVGPLPAREPGAVTLGSFNNPAKLTAEVVAVWAEVLARLPRARLVLKYMGLEDPAVARRLIERFAGHGVGPGRVECRGWSPHAVMLAEYNGIDLALDPFPFNGGATTCEALWMGVPIVTCPGETFAGRHSLTHLSNLGLTETIARDLDEYVGLAVSLAEDLPRLAGLRARLRGQMAGSPLCDGTRFAANLTQVLRGVWRRWAARGT
jgi:predicted O-linked N-acetylglucosamine transferase (SPINDLY family)